MLVYKQKRIQAEISLIIFIINLVWIQHTRCDVISTEPGTNKWACTCSIARQGNLDVIPANCSSSCSCSPSNVESHESKWTCICAADGLPKVGGNGNDSSCFTACNCNAGTLTELQPSKKRISRNVIVIVLLLCIILAAALAFIGSVLWFFYQKDKHYLVQYPLFSSDRKPSGRSAAANLIGQDASSVALSKGYIPRTSSFLRSKTGALHGSIIQFSYSELENATKRFSDANLIGFGGSGYVYRGDLRDGGTVAVKKMKTLTSPDADHVFSTEIELITRLHHCNVVSLLGYCFEYREKRAMRLLVFEYIPNGNLRECLDGNLGQCLEWNTRVAIAIGAARGLEYLHEAAAPRILHRDVKSTNILLDENWSAMITDLGMAKHLEEDGIASCSSSPARMQGTFGYFAPEYAIIGRASFKSDIFSFGVVLLELITGRKPIHKSSNKLEESLVIWATPRLHDSKRIILELPDPRLKGNFNEEEMQVMAYLAKECLLLDPDSRPSMSEVVQILSTISPEKSNRKSMFQARLSAGNPEPYEESHFDDSGVEEIKQITSERTAQQFLKGDKETENTSSDIEKLILLTSKSRSWRLPDDEVVDLTEPRLESFCLPKDGSLHNHHYSIA